MSKKQIWLILLALATVYLVIKFRQERVINRSLVDAKVQEIVMFEKAEYEKT